MNNSSGEGELNVVDELLRDCLQRISEGDPGAAFDLAQVYFGHVDDNDAHIPIAIVEGLVRQSVQLGSSEAQVFFENQWPNLKNILAKRLKRRGFKLSKKDL